jgi:hypothetical protein
MGVVEYQVPGCRQPPMAVGSLRSLAAAWQALGLIVRRSCRSRRFWLLVCVLAMVLGLCLLKLFVHPFALEIRKDHHLGRDAFFERAWAWKPASGGRSRTPSRPGCSGQAAPSACAPAHRAARDRDFPG